MDLIIFSPRAIQFEIGKYMNPLKFPPQPNIDKILIMQSGKEIVQYFIQFLQDQKW